MVRSFLKSGLVLCLAMLAGCSGSDRPKLAETVGVVTFKGQPLPTANVVFMPASGPPAYATTDSAGVFALSTQGDPGAMVGSGTFIITAFEQLPEKKPEHLLTAADLKKMNTSLIPAKYGRPETSGLKETIKPDVKNEFKFDLQ
ncbi:hypothetical protein AYO47_00705 [Planctomyces sp. SCGC AG-212-M04]|nr:hypothetical protein AYO47_00705 [Planctomyces sp. SCGC AG-212-M04]